MATTHEKPPGLMLDLSDIPSFRAHYNKAVKESQKTFKFKGAEILVDYAKYVLEYANTFKQSKR